MTDLGEGVTQKGTKQEPKTFLDAITEAGIIQGISRRMINLCGQMVPTNCLTASGRIVAVTVPVDEGYLALCRGTDIDVERALRTFCANYGVKPLCFHIDPEMHLFNGPNAPRDIGRAVMEHYDIADTLSRFGYVV